MNKIIRTILTLSILYWTMFYVINDNGLWLPIPFILIGVIWFYDYDNKKDYKDRYEIKQNNSGEYYVWDNKKDVARYLSQDYNWWYRKDNDNFCYCLTKNKEIAELFLNRIIS